VLQKASAIPNWGNCESNREFGAVKISRLAEPDFRFPFGLCEHSERKCIVCFLEQAHCFIGECSVVREVLAQHYATVITPWA